MKRVFIVQARMASTRLPGKVLMNLDGKPMLSQQLARLRACTTADAVVVACTANESDDAIVDLAQRGGAFVFRGDEHNVLSRYLGAARAAEADVVVRLTADCPLICPEICDRVVRALSEMNCDYASNTLKRTFPRGLDCEALTRAALEKAAKEAVSSRAREHVTWRIHTEDRPSYRLHSIEDVADHSDLRWTVDEMADFEVVQRLWEGLRLSERVLGYPEILAYALANPEIGALNLSVAQKDAF